MIAFDTACRRQRACRQREWQQAQAKLLALHDYRPKCRVALLGCHKEAIRSPRTLSEVMSLCTPLLPEESRYTSHLKRKEQQKTNHVI